MYGERSVSTDGKKNMWIFDILGITMKPKKVEVKIIIRLLPISTRKKITNIAYENEVTILVLDTLVPFPSLEFLVTLLLTSKSAT